MIQRRVGRRPCNWRDFNAAVSHRWLWPVLFFEWSIAWAAYYLGRTSFLEFLEYCGSFSILIGVIFYFMGSSDRLKLKHYQAWQVINTAQGKGGSGGRADALHELNDDHIPLVGVDLSTAFLQNIELIHADLRRSKFNGTDLKSANLSRSNLQQSQLISANLRSATLANVDFTQANLADTDLTQADVARCDLTRTDLRSADISGLVNWQSILSIRLANIHEVQNPPEGFIAWALRNGAVDANDEQWKAAIKSANAGREQ